MYINKKDKVVKIFKTKEEVKHFVYLYNQFPHHVRAKENDKKLEYKYIEGSTLQDVLIKNEDIIKITIKLAQILSKIHFSNIELIADYDKLCIERKLYPNKNKFIKSTGYITKIHGDLHPANIIINKNQEIVFIDRLKDKEDMLFDFSFILSYLCFFFETRNYIYIRAIKEFFKIYLNNFKHKENFYIAFRNNYLNYLHLIANSNFYKKLPFSEWKYSEQILLGLENKSNFLEYLDSLIKEV